MQLLKLTNCGNSCFFFQHASYEPPDEDEENELDYYSDGEYALYFLLQRLLGNGYKLSAQRFLGSFGWTSVCVVDNLVPRSLADEADLYT